MDKNQKANLESNIVSIILAGALFGSVSASWVARRIGYRLSLMCAGIIVRTGMALFVAGIAVGIASTTNPLYVSENAPRATRGLLTGLYQFNIVTGLCLAFWINYGSLQHQSGKARCCLANPHQAAQPPRNTPLRLDVFGNCTYKLTEIPSQRLHPLTMSIATSLQWVFAFSVAKVTPLMFATLGKNAYGTFSVYGNFCFCAAAFAFFFVPETKGIGLEHMDELFATGNVRGAFIHRPSSPKDKPNVSNVEYAIPERV
ncbi:hypothetical protein FSARC_10750 [Fusarium sarcochroum]|uniref:Quinate permease n=1 Tax=Fusarium sarcochroum TaxID=1208366 RepID=A0A8H4X361_9HYPO|nr:hypothetical protein FSARC_10750 [Fusarium sarcochroum]